MPNNRLATPVHRYPNGESYHSARGRYAPSDQVSDHRRFEASLAVVDLSVEISPREFLDRIRREFRIRFYQPSTIRNYCQAITSFLRWLGGSPSRVRREHVRDYLEYMVDAGASSSLVAVHFSAIRTSFDKFCFCDVTLGLATPRKPRRLPVVISRDEIRRLLESAISLRDKLLIGLMYATGMRVSEVVRLRLRDIELDRDTIRVWQGKGRADRIVMLPDSYRSLFQALTKQQPADSLLFPGDRDGRYVSPRTVQRVMARTVRLAGIGKRATPHSLRHAFATHSFENGCDIRRIQKILGHVNLETTTIYVRVAKPADPHSMPSPLDKLQGRSGQSQSPLEKLPSASRKSFRAVGHLKIHSRPDPENSLVTQITLAISTAERVVYLPGIRATQPRPGFVSLSIPSQEQWSEPARWLTREQRERIEEPEFYERIRDAITRQLRFC